jgi:hypothetical protein
MSPKYIKAAIFLMICCSSSCKKLWPPNNNELRATAKLISGETVVIKAMGSNAEMFCYVGFSIGNSGLYPGLGLQTFDPNNRGCINSPGTYSGSDFWCTFKRDTGMFSPLYSNIGVSNPGSITFTAFSEKYVECHFTAICKHGANDSVIINGTFKGDFMSQP